MFYILLLIYLKQSINRLKTIINILIRVHGFRFADLMGNTKIINISSSEDHKLWERVQQNSCSESFTCLFDKYWDTLYSTAFSYLKDHQKSEEITLDIFLNLWNKRETLTIQYFPAYLRSASRYHVYKEFKKIKSSKVVYQEELSTLAESVANKGEDKLIYQEAESYIDNSLEALPKRCQEIYVLSRKESLNNDEIAEKLNISKRTVENQLTRALRHIRLKLKAITTILLSLLLL